MVLIIRQLKRFFNQSIIKDKRFKDSKCVEMIAVEAKLGCS